MEIQHELPSERTVRSLKVLNDNPFPIEDMYDGVPYTFETGKPLTIPGDAARHIFGWFDGVDMNAVRQHVTKRWGWNTPSIVEKGDHKKFFDRLTFVPVTYRLVEVVADNTEDVAEPVDDSKANRGAGGRFARKEASPAQS